MEIEEERKGRQKQVVLYRSGTDTEENGFEGELGKVKM